MIEVGFDKARNLFRVTFSGQVDAGEAKRSNDQIAALFPDITPGFRLLTDMTGLETMDKACVPFIKISMDLLNEHGVGTVVRVISDPHKDIGFNILSLFHYRRGLRIVTCETLEEAMKALAS